MSLAPKQLVLTTELTDFQAKVLNTSKFINSFTVIHQCAYHGRVSLQSRTCALSCTGTLLIWPTSTRLSISYNLK